MSKSQITVKILRISAFIMVLSRGCLYVFQGSPLRSLLWNENLFSPVVEIFGTKWTHYANVSDPYISVLEIFLGLFLIVSSFFFLKIKSQEETIKYKSLQYVGFLMLFHVILHFMGHNNELPIIPEYMVQGLTPWIFLSLLPYMPKNEAASWSKPTSDIYFWLKLSISCCFLGHGLYAFGIPYQPASFVRLMSKSTFIDFDTAALLVKLVGVADIALAITIFIKPLEKITLGHMAFWGFATAFSRVMAYVVIPGQLSYLNPWLFETTVRFVHGAIPLFLMLMLKWQFIESENPSLVSTKNWFKSWHSLPLSIITFLFCLSLISYDKSFAAEKHKSALEEKLASKKIKKERRIKVRSDNSSLKDEFKLSQNSYLYSDDLFFFENVPIRLILDTDINNPDTTNLTPFLENSEKITDSLREHIINKFHEHREVDYDEQKIIRFTQKVYLTCDGQEYLTAAVYLPWIKGGILNIQISSTGQIHEIK